MTRFIITAILTGVLFGLMDGIIHTNTYALKLLECYQPIAKQSINVPMGLVIDLFYGFMMSAIFLVLKSSLPTDQGIIKGLTYGLGMWFFRVLMGVVSDWMMFNIPVNTSIYILLTGLIEMTILGVINGLILTKRNPATQHII